MKRFPLLVAALVALALALPFAIGSDDAQAQGQPDNAGLAQAIAVQESHTDALMARAGVVGTAVALTQSGDAYTVAILVEHGGLSGLPTSLDGIPVRVMVTGKIEALHHRPGHNGGPSGGGGIDRTAKFDRPVPIGVSTGHPDITAGTIGARVTDGTDVYALSNNHVYADQNDASLGDGVIQPGAFDGGSSPADDLGTLFAFEPIDFGGGDNTIDAAIALTSTDDLDNGTPSDGYGVPSSTTTVASVGMDVKKYGRTTGETHSSISAINAELNVGYGSGTAHFVGQIVVSGGSFSDGGDSGSLIVTENGNNPVGLLYAGSRFATIANPIQAVLTEFGVTFDASPPPLDTTDPIITNVTETLVTATSATITWDTDEPSDSTVNYGKFDVSELSENAGAPVISHSVMLTGLSANTDYVYEVVSTDGSDNEATVSGTGFTTAAAAAPGNLSVGSISPSFLSTGTTKPLALISGSGFEPGASVIFENGTGPAPSVTDVEVAPGGASIAVTVTVPSGGPPRERVWDLRVTNPGGASDVAQDAFTVTP